METEHYPHCAGCDGALKPGDPFCVDCGRLSPPMLGVGAYSVEVQDVPSQRSRSEFVSILKAWFPRMDALRAAERLRSEWQILVRGVDETSARRLQDTLKRLKIDSRLIREKAERPWKQRLLNPGLAVSGTSVLLSLLLGAVAAVFLLPMGIAAPFIWAFIAARRQEPVLHLEAPSFLYEKWSLLAQEYAEVFKELESPDREIVRCLSRTVFDLQHRLGSDSLAAVAAGEDRGDLYGRLKDAIRTALSLGRRISDLDEGEERGSLRQELVDLTKMVSETAEWFRSLEQSPSKEPAALDSELREVTQRIDRILGQVRHPNQVSQRPRKSLDA